MTNKQIETELGRARAFAESVAAALEDETDTNALIELETALNGAKSVVARLESRLAAQVRKEADAADAAVRADLDRQLDQLRAEHAELVGSCAEVAGELATALQDALDGLWGQRGELLRVNGEHRSLFLKRHGRWPDENEALRPFAWMLPSVAAERPEIVALVQHVTLAAGVMRERGTSLEMALVHMAAPRPIDTKSHTFQPRQKTERRTRRAGTRV